MFYYRHIIIFCAMLLLVSLPFGQTSASSALIPEQQVADQNYAGNISLSVDATYDWHTFWGGWSSIDDGFAIAHDATGIYVVGTSSGTWDGPGGVPPLNPFSGISDIVVLKLDNAGTYQWHTFYGSADNDQGLAVTSDGIGNIYITGTSIDSWAGPNNVPPLNAHSNSYDNDMIVVKLDSNGAYQWHTFYGTAGIDKGFAVTSRSDNIYITGTSVATWDGPSGATPLHTYTGGSLEDIVVLKLSDDGQYQWHTFYGSSNNDYGYGITSNANEDIYIAGSSDATWNGPGAPLNYHAGGTADIVIVKLDKNGIYQWHTFYGSNNYELGVAITNDNNGNIVITGYGNATWDGPGLVAPLNPFNTPAALGPKDIIVLKLNADGIYQWHTFYGSADNDWGNGITSDGDGNIFVAGLSDATWDGPGPVAPLNSHAGASRSDIAVLKLNSVGVYQWHTFYGETAFDRGYAITNDDSGNVYIAGSSNHTWNGPGATSPLNPYSNSWDIAVVKMVDGNSLATPTPTQTPISAITQTLTPASTPTTTSTATEAVTPTETPTLALTPTLTDTQTGIPSLTHTLTPLSSPTATSTPTVTSTVTQTITSTRTATVTSTSTPIRMTQVFTSIAAQDGWVLESSEFSNIGGTLNKNATTFNLGDNAANKQYRSILHFNTDTLPDTAVVTSVTLKILKQRLVGTNPFATHGKLLADIRKPFFGTGISLLIGDFQAIASASAVGKFGSSPLNNWYSAVLNSAGRININRTGTTQFRLRFALDDNNDLGTDYMKFFSGNATTANRPQLIVTYYIP